MTTKGGRKNLKRAAIDEKTLTVELGNFVVVDDSGREEAIESGRKVACVVVQVLSHEQVRVLQKCPEWPETFKSASSSVQEDSELNSE